MPVLRNIGGLVTRAAAGIRPLPDAALAWQGDRIAWAGPEAELPGRFAGEPSHDAGGRLVIPGLVDAHTHLAFGGWRAGEWVRRIRGEDYRMIARGGGGIAATVRATREADEATLLDRAAGFLRGMTALGVTTVEAKSGYGLTLEEELKLLRVYRRLGERADLPRVVPTFLGAHVPPPHPPGGRKAHVARIAGEWVPAVAEAGLARFCDVFVEEGAFTPEEARRILEAGREAGLRPKLHVDQLGEGGGAELAAELGAVSADHLEHVSPQGIAALAEAGTVAVLLPLATLYLDGPPAPARALLEAGVPVAVATDFNPGTAPSYHLPLALLLACARQRMTPAEAIRGATLHAARAVGEVERAGSLEPGKSADFAVLDAPDVESWLYHFRANACVATVARGRPLYHQAEAGVFPGDAAVGERGSA